MSSARASLYFALIIPSILVSNNCKFEVFYVTNAKIVFLFFFVLIKVESSKFFKYFTKVLSFKVLTWLLDLLI